MSPPPEPKRNDPSEWTEVAAAYEEVNDPFMGLFAEEAIRLAALSPEETVLDVATGPGTLAIRAATRVKKVVATDYADGMLERLRARVAREGLQNVDVKRMNGQALELASESFDAAFSAFGLIFFPDRGKGFRELLRVLKPGGRAVVLAWAPMDRAPVLSAMIRGVREALPDLPPPPAGVPPAFSLQDPARFATEMTEAGFDEVEISTRTISETLPGSVEEFFDRQVPANLMVASLSKTLPAEKWAEVRTRACARMREAIGDGPTRVTAEAHLGIGRREPEQP